MTATSPESCWGGEGNLPGTTVEGGVVKRGVVVAAYVALDGGVKRVSGGEGCWSAASKDLFSLLGFGGVDSRAEFFVPSWVLVPLALVSVYQLVVGIDGAAADVGEGIGVWVRGLLGYSASPPPVRGSRLRGGADEEVDAVLAWSAATATILSTATWTAPLDLVNTRFLTPA